MAPATDPLEIAIMERKPCMKNSPALNWKMANAVATTDSAGNSRLEKDKAVFRIDGAVALAMAMRAPDRGRVPVFCPEALIS